MSDTYCSTCYEELEEAFNKYGIILTDDDYECISCNTGIEVGDMYYCIDFSEVVLAVDELAEVLSQYIDACFNCKGREIDDYYYAWNKDADSEEYQEKSVGTSIEDFLFNHDIPELIHNELTKQLQCQHCHYGKDPMHPKHNPDGGIFELYDEVYTQKEIDDFWGFDYEEFSEFAARYGITLGKMDFSDFKEYISKNPLLAFKHPVGQNIYDVLKNHFEAEDYIVLKKGNILYRGRSRKIDAEMFMDKQMWSPPRGVASHGRYNLIGTSVLYCSDKVKCIPLEIHPGHDEAVDIGIFETKNDLKLLNIDFFENFGGFFSEKDEDTKTLKEVYLLPNFIRDCCYEIGYHGVKYEGVHQEENYTNYAFFNIVAGFDIQVKKVYTLDMKIKYVVEMED
ncbi:RES domain-containing protein [Bacillus sp. FJAT-29814]|uniref:RES domain-containing protein n=1 Tax=Bacillus sp. FJAT-29814 TaxID=1729688 RepID=UPI0008337126|nr:RES domain-containing protein [Bacillus sp. FJAT-29814]